MISLTTPNFWRTYQRLPLDVRPQADKAFALWMQNPFHPSLQFKKKVAPFWSARISGTGCRAVARVQGEEVVWLWIGKHDDYLRLLRELAKR